MYFEQFYLGCLAHASYMIASEVRRLSWTLSVTWRFT